MPELPAGFLEQPIGEVYNIIQKGVGFQAMFNPVDDFEFESKWLMIMTMAPAGVSHVKIICAHPERGIWYSAIDQQYTLHVSDTIAVDFSSK